MTKHTQNFSHYFMERIGEKPHRSRQASPPFPMPIVIGVPFYLARLLWPRSERTRIGVTVRTAFEFRGLIVEAQHRAERKMASASLSLPLRYPNENENGLPEGKPLNCWLRGQDLNL